MTLRTKLAHLAYNHPDLRPSLLPLLRRAADGHRLLRDVDSKDYKSLLITGAYETPQGLRWHPNLMQMDPKALDDRSQWTDAKLKKFSAAVERSKGTAITLIRIYGRRVDNGKLETLIDWSPTSGFMTEREGERIQKELAQQALQEKNDRKNFDNLLMKALGGSGLKVETWDNVLQVEGQRLFVIGPRKPQEGAYWSFGGQAGKHTKATTSRAAIDEIIKEIRATIKTLPKTEPESVWSVAQTGYEVGGDAEEEFQGYVAEVQTFSTKEEAIAYARSLGGATVVKGTQMWNEPMGQVEESNRTAWMKFYR